MADFTNIVQATNGFDSYDDVDCTFWPAISFFHFFNFLRYDFNFRNIFSFRQTNHIRFCWNDNIKIIITIRCLCRMVDTNYSFSAEFTGFQCFCSQKTSCVFFCNRHGIFDIDHDRVRTVDISTVNHFWCITRNEHHGTG